jgi:hypothetical protein
VEVYISKIRGISSKSLHRGIFSKATSFPFVKYELMHSENRNMVLFLSLFVGTTYAEIHALSLFVGTTYAEIHAFRDVLFVHYQL